MGLWVLAALADRPAKARWLTDAERAWLRAELEREAPSGSTESHRFTWRLLGDSKVLTLAAVFFFTGVPSYGLSLWLPQIVKSFGVSHVVTGLLSAVPFLFGSIAMVYWGHRSDARRERVWHTIVPAAVAGIALIGGALLTAGVMQLLAVCVAAAGIYALKGPFLTIVSESFTDNRAAAGIAIVTTLGNLSGFVAPYMVGLIIEATGSHRPGLAALGAQSVLGALILFGAAAAVRPQRPVLAR
jgi:cyanate permease